MEILMEIAHESRQTNDKKSNLFFMWLFETKQGAKEAVPAGLSQMTKNISIFFLVLGICCPLIEKLKGFFS